MKKLGWSARGLALASMLAVAGCGGEEVYNGPRVPLKVMTRNLYLGSDLLDVVLSLDQAKLLANVNVFWKAVTASDFPGRAKLLAAEIAAAAPDLVALQEVEIFRTDPVSNFNFAAPAVDAQLPAIDFLALLRAELAALSARYVVAAETPLSDVEMPGLADDGTQFDVRMTDRDVILAKEGVATSNPIGAPFTKYVEVPIAGMSNLKVQLRRGYTTVDAVIGGTTFVFANAHLEVEGPLAPFQENQATELVSILKRRMGQIVLAGDFNSAADGSDSKSYGILRKVFDDPYAALMVPGTGYTCCVNLQTGVGGNRRIDLILTRGPISAIDARVVGFDPGAARTPSGLVASDHAGVSMTLGIKPAAP